MQISTYIITYAYGGRYIGENIHYKEIEAIDEKEAVETFHKNWKCELVISVIKKAITTLKLSGTNREIIIRTIGNNGNQIVSFMHNNDLIKDGMTAEQIADIIRPYMIKEHHLDNDDLWEDVFYSAAELGYKLIY